MSKRKALIPYHFDKDWSKLILWECFRHSNWHVVDQGTLRSKLDSVSGYDIVVSGDCMAALGCHRSELDLVWYDAHGDFNTIETTKTGSIGGMVLSMLTEKQFKDRTDSKILHVGGCDFDHYEDGTNEKGRMLARGLYVVRSLPMIPFLDKIHLHIDTDVVRISECSNSAHPPSNGIPKQQLLNDVRNLKPLVSVLSIKTPEPNPQNNSGELLVTQILEIFDDVS